MLLDLPHIIALSDPAWFVELTAPLVKANVQFNLIKGEINTGTSEEQINSSVPGLPHMRSQGAE